MTLAHRLRCAHRPVSHQFAVFVVNGGLIGLACWAMQLGLFSLLGGGRTSDYWVSALLASAIGIAINYRIQRHIIFGRHGNFWVFAAAATAVSVVVSFAAVLGREALATVFAADVANRFGYVLGALGVAPLSFMLKKFLIFRGSAT